MTNTQRAAMQQALDALEYAHATNRHERTRQDQAIAALRQALVEPVVESEPIGEVVACNDHGHPWKRVSGYEWSLAELPIGTKVYASPPPAEVPLLAELREMLERRAHDSYSCGLLAKAALQLLDSQTRSIPLLTDEEIKNIHTQLCNTVGSYYLSVARAIEQAVRQKAGVK